MTAETIPNVHIQYSDVGSQQVYSGRNARKSTCNKDKNQWVPRDNPHVSVGEKNSGTTISPRGKTFIVGYSELDTKKTQLGPYTFISPSSFEVGECSNSIIDIGPTTILARRDFKLTSNSPKGIECNRVVFWYNYHIYKSDRWGRGVKLLLKWSKHLEGLFSSQSL